jgi:GNAT superfamily N-acetyltransferase
MNYTIKNVTSEYELERVLAFAQRVFGKNKPGLEVQSRNKWLERMNVHPELMLFAEANGEVISIVLSFLESNGNITIGIVATDERYRKHGIARELMLLIEKRAKALGVHLLALGSTETAEGFYAKLGYTGQLLIQSQKHTIDELLSQNPGYPIAFTNIYDGTVNQVCLKLPQADRALQKLYETTFDDCYTQTMFWKTI